MTREEAITVLKAFMDNPLFSDIHKAAFNIAIHDIEAYQKWNLNELVLRPKEVSDNSVLEDIKAQIEEVLEIDKGLNIESAKAQAIALGWCIEIIDKHISGKG